MSSPAGSRDRGPILVTGMPRSGTTWAARGLAASPGTAMTGREPMNPRNRQYALGGSLDGWARLTEPTSRQRRLLKAAYSGLNPLVYGRYGVRQWAAALPSTRVVIKDPFAMLSLPAIVEHTAAVPIVVYRHPGAVLVSYRRMGWTPDSSELEAFADEPLVTDESSDLEEFAAMWNLLHDLALDDLADCPTALVVSHEDLAAGGEPTMAALRSLCGLKPAAVASDSPASDTVDEQRLHNLDRDPRDVATAWRSQLDEGEQQRLEELTASVLTRLHSRSVQLAADPR